MDQNKVTDILLDMVNNTASWSIDEEGELGGSYKGLFTFKCFLSPVEQLQAGRVYRDLLGSNTDDSSSSERSLAYCLTQLKYRIVKSPPFWKSETQIDGGHIPDLDILFLIFDKAISAEIMFKEAMKKKREESLQKAIEAAEKAKKKVTKK